MTDIVIQGIGGRMGHVLCDMIAQREDCRVIAGIDLKDGEQNGIPVYDLSLIHISAGSGRQGRDQRRVQCQAGAGAQLLQGIL